ncbi:hypothetical protein SBOR_9904 [Sclerotinia borealis F-4128]|uniref:Uncharacterized protein n=1 Tax=Sclerotinia borealis (strain F-4128) TaxID=1432307 RepID=W9C547_SCLBF|nr:hypothetical protein SBOR_9904 [Sclerotinia borealis F-4128]
MTYQLPQNGELEVLQRHQSLSKSLAMSDLIRRELGSENPMPNYCFKTAGLGDQLTCAILKVEQHILWGKEKEWELRNQEEYGNETSRSDSFSSPTTSGPPHDPLLATKRSALSTWIKQMQQFSTAMQGVYLETIKVEESLVSLERANPRASKLWDRICITRYS